MGSISPWAWKKGISGGGVGWGWIGGTQGREEEAVTSVGPLLVHWLGSGSLASGKKVERAMQPARGSG